MSGLCCWLVSVETRKPGAIGIFERIGVRVAAETQARAIHLACDALRAAGWETRAGDVQGVAATDAAEEGILTPAIETPDPDADWFRCGGIAR